MAVQQTEALLDTAIAESMSKVFNRCFETLDAPEDLFAHDAFFDLLPPFWRFQFQGRDAFVSQLRAISAGMTTARVLRVVPTATGFVMEHEATEHGAQVEVARRLWLCEVHAGRITEVVGYCNGGWNDELRQRHLAEAPMMRP